MINVPDFVEAYVEDLIEREGGYSNRADDRGGETMYGVTKAVARAAGYEGPMEDMPRPFAREVYLRRFFYGPRVDKIAVFSHIIAEEVFDSGVNFGPTVPAVWLQRWLNGLNRQGRDYPDLVVDGAIGDKTASALRDYLAKRGREGELILFVALNSAQGDKYLGLSEGWDRNESNLYGWMRTRVFEQLRRYLT